MNESAIEGHVDRRLNSVFRSRQVGVSAPGEGMVKLAAVPVGDRFNKQCTHVLFHCSSGGPWQVFVDEDLVYRGDDPVRRTMLLGRSRRGWQGLAPRWPVRGSINRAILWALQRLESPLVFELSIDLLGDDRFHDPAWEAAATSALSIEQSYVARDPLEPLLGSVVEELALDSLVPADVVLAATQEDAVRRTAETVVSSSESTGACLVGRSGVGKSLVARLAAAELIRHRVVRRAVLFHGTAVGAGSLFGPERDERLARTLQVLLETGECLVILEQFDLALLRSDITAPLLASALDRGLRLIAVARPEFRFGSIRSVAMLRRRLERIRLPPTDDYDTADILRRRLNQHPTAGKLDFPTPLVSLIVELSHRRPGGNPAAALRLLDAVLTRASLTERASVGPDDIYHFVPLAGD